MIRQKIVNTLVEALQNITVKNGFYTDGLKVHEWLSKPLEVQDYPAVIVRDIKDELQDTNPLEHKLFFEIDIAINGSDTSVRLRDILSDVLRAIGEFERQSAYDTHLLSNEFLLEHADRVYGGVRVEFYVVYHTNRWEQ